MAKRIAAVPLVLAALVFFHGCGGESDSTEPAAKVEVRGEAIETTPERGEPIEKARDLAESAPSIPSLSAPETQEAVAVEQPGSVTELSAVVPKNSEAETAVATAAEAPREESSSAAVNLEKGTPEKPLSVPFEKLASFQYDIPEGPLETNAAPEKEVSAKIPESIQALNDSYVSIKGFMLPLKVEKGLVTELLIMRDQSMCCYGTVPKINEWVSVKMLGSGVKPVMDQAVTLFGRLKVGEMYENGYLVGIYALDGDRMAGPLDM